MKRFSAVSIIGLILLFFQSCDDTTDTFTISKPTAPILAELNFTQLELDAVNTSNPALTLNWDEANYGIQAAVNYAIQFSKEDTFITPITASTITGQTSVTLSISEVNSAAGSTGVNPFNWSDVYIRIVASLGTQNTETATSNVIKLNVYPYFNYVFEDYFLVGNGLAPGWNNNNNNPPLFRDHTDSNTFYYTGLIKNDNSGYDDGRFKILENIGLWQPQWGEINPEGSDDPSESGKVAGNPGTQSSDPGRFGVTSTGYYTFKINFASKDYTLVSYDAAGKTSPTSLEIQGTSTLNVAMTPLDFDGHLWYAKSIRLTPGNIEFVTDASAKWGSSTSFSGLATDGGGEIPVIVEDDYDVWFNDLTGRYIFIPLNL
ncbi:SusE domain-containing protein [Polaribacter sp. PL03]|uniref:SusE domain-containing protein n=1 Tax=Polaribacter sp. PL03 TaxID=3088353 RepID=UPI0029CF5EA5|nr:SusE domain-containing protein [Polaribacter sp. PL03]MDX6746280.1 SusE domain-containing protein [Polaribacter sp. PL03]